MKMKFFILLLVMIALFCSSRCASAPKEKGGEVTAQNFEVSETFYLENDEEVIWTLESTGYDGKSPDNPHVKFIPEL